MRAQAIDSQQPQCEENPLAQIRHIEHVANSGEKLFHNQVTQNSICVPRAPGFEEYAALKSTLPQSPLTVPPAFSIFPEHCA